MEKNLSLLFLIFFAIFLYLPLSAYYDIKDNIFPGKEIIGIKE